MKNVVFILMGMFALLISCSSDKDSGAEVNGSSKIIGTWDVNEFRIDEATGTDEAFFAREALKILVDKNCYIITLEFNEDMTATATNSANYLVINTDNGFPDIQCPNQWDTETKAYTYDANVVSFVDDTGEVVEVNVSIEGDVMIVDAAELQIPDFNESGQLVFQRR